MRRLLPDSNRGQGSPGDLPACVVGAPSAAVRRPFDRPRASLQRLAPSCYLSSRRRAASPSVERAEIAQSVEHATENRGVASSILALGTINGWHRLSSGSGSVGRASPCQGEGRGFESRLPLHSLMLPIWTVARQRSSLCPFV